MRIASLNPAAWLTQTARQLALDRLRREQRRHDRQEGIALEHPRWLATPVSRDENADTFTDDTLRLMFVCFHPQLCHEAIRLTLELAAHPATRQPRTHALLALMLLNAARLPARTDDAGQLLRLHEQDRTVWNRGMIARGLHYLALASTGDHLSE